MERVSFKVEVGGDYEDAIDKMCLRTPWASY